MPVNAHAQRVARATGRNYHEVRKAVNLLVGWDVANRDDAERMVEEWAAEDGSLDARAREAIEEASHGT